MERTTEGAHRLRGYSMAVLAAVCWAANGLLANWLFAGSDAGSWRVDAPSVAIDARVLAADRALVAVVLLAAALGAVDRRAFRIRLSDAPFLAAFGLVGMAGVQYTYYRTIEVTGQPAVAILLEYLAPVIVLVLSVAMLGERLTWSLPLGVALALGGCALVVGAVGPGEGLSVSGEGLAWGLTSAAFFAAYSLLGRYAARRFGPWTLLVYGLGAAAVVWLAALGPRTVLAPLADPVTLVSVAFSAVVGTIVPFGAYLMALRVLDATKVSVTASLEPVVVAAGGWALFAQSLSAAQIVGGLLVVAAILAVQIPVGGSALPPPE